MMVRCYLLLIVSVSLAAQSYLITTLAGNQVHCGSGGMAIDASRTTYLVVCQRVQRITPDGRVEIIAGRGGGDRPAGDGGLAMNATTLPSDIAVDERGNIYLAETTEPRVRRIRPDGVIQTIAVFSSPVSSIAAAMDGTLFMGVGKSVWKRLPDGSIIQLLLEEPVVDMAVGPQGDLFITTTGQGVGQLRRIRPDGTASFVDAQVSDPYRIAIDIKGNLFYSTKQTITRLDPQGTRSTFGPPTGYRLFTGDNQGGVQFPLGADLIRLTADGFVGAINIQDTGDDGPVATALYRARGIALDGSGNTFLADIDSGRIRKIDARGIITTVASDFKYPHGIALDSSGNMYVSDSQTHSVFRIDRAGNKSKLAGNGTAGYSGDDGPALRAALDRPAGVAIDTLGNLYVVDIGNRRIRRVSTAGLISTIHEWDEYTVPSPVVADKKGNVYFADITRRALMKRTPDGSLSSMAPFSFLPTDLAVDDAGTFYIADFYGCKIWKASPGLPPVSIAGTGRCGLENDYGLATQAQLRGPGSLTVDRNGVVQFTDDSGAYIRKLEPANLFPRAIVNAASQEHGPVAPGEVLTMYWIDVEPKTAKVFVDDIAAPILFADGQQANIIVPFEIAGRSAVAIRVESSAGRTNTVFLQSTPTAPGLFLPIRNPNGSLNPSDSSAAEGDIVTAYGTGCGQTSPPGRTGGVATALLKPTVSLVTATIDGRPAEVTYAGSAPGLVEGICQFNIRVPPVRGAVPLVVSIGGVVSNAIQIFVSSR
jgi:uncharacterized protein (TIGR03437 family)